MSAPTTRTVRHATRRPGHPVLTGFAWAAATLVGFGAVLTQTYVSKAEAQITTIDIEALLGPDRPAPALPPADGAAGLALNIVLIGSDARDGENESIGGYEAGMRSDTALLMHISADRSRVEVISFPRDSMVKLAPCTRANGTTQRTYTGMFNEAFANGATGAADSATAMAYGAACTIATIESLTNIRVDHYAVVDFSGMVRTVDAVGGVPMCIQKDVYDKYTGLDLKAGPIVMDGYTATQYARMRHGTGLSGSDLDRIDRQQILLKNLARKVMGTEVLFNPKALTDFLAAALSSVTVDPQLGDITYDAGLAFSLRNLNLSEDLIMGTVPVRGYAPDPNRVEFIPQASAAIFAAIANDQPIVDLLDKQSTSPANDLGPSPSAGDGGDGGDGGTSTGGGPVRESEADILAGC